MIRTLVVVIPLIFASVLSSGATPSAPRPSGVATNSFDVRDFGARGDGKTKDTTAVQRALHGYSAWNFYEVARGFASLPQTHPVERG